MLFVVLTVFRINEIVNLPFYLLQNGLLILIDKPLSEFVLEHNDLPERVVHQLLLS